ncbi:proline--tRNA ligase [Prochlorococcus sp. MIT 1341]|uniref:proline--tRNA ligase n=1 Tax=Prochlorococcus sp. MIT 1341 TaxID=3096221 RepID=UPI002A7656D7|nr:proline--tRNA ligase [Prochlorococcus sp. MIT 1341]
MRVSRLMLVTLREVPADAEISSHKLLLRGGYIRRVTAGVYAYLPLMWRVLKKIISIIQEEMDSTGALETLLPQLQPAELWEQSGRWQGYTEGEGIMFNLVDRQNRKLGLGPTHEEVITSLAGDILRSYRQLPTTLYQTQTKFRDEIRPRFGLMRSREFIMKDAYSFHATEQSLQDTYEKMDNAYRRIFKRCGIEVLPVDADSGAIGGTASQEFMVPADSGEDLILTSEDNSYSANEEKAISLPLEAKPLTEGKYSVVETPFSGSIEELSSNLEMDPSQIIKVIVMIATLEGNEFQPLLICLRGDQDLNEVKLSNVITNLSKKRVIEITPITPEKISLEGLSPFPFGAIGPDLSDDVLCGARTWIKNFMRISDNTASQLKSFVCGANEIHHHRVFTKWENIAYKPETSDIRKAQPGDKCCHDPKQKLQAKRGIEVGHIFQLGRKYSEVLGSTFTNENGSLEPFWMGCYGIGVSRLAQAVVEQNHDDAGIYWPIAIAPFEVIIVVANIQDSTQSNLGEQLYKKLKENDIDVLLDDRKERAGVKFNDADLIGIPFRIVVGRNAKEGNVELWDRANKTSKLLGQKDAVSEVISEINGSST